MDRTGGALQLPERPGAQPARTLHWLGPGHPALLIIFILQRYFVEGYRQSGLKG